jgi:hypothetical protein
VQQLLFQSGRQSLRQHHHPVFAALGFAHDDGTPLKTHIFDAQVQTFHQAHTGTVKQLG